MALVLSGSIDISGSMTATTILVSSPGAAGMVSSSAQITELAPLMQSTSSINNLTGSLITTSSNNVIAIDGLNTYTASLKGAAIVSSSQQIQNYFTFAKTGSANTFYGNQSITGSIGVTGDLSGSSATFKVSSNRNLAIKYDTNITLSGQNDSGAPENLRIYADTFKIFTSTTTVGLTERFNVGNTGNVGIETPTPDTTLHISGSDGIKIQAGGNADTPGLTIINHTNQYGWAKFGGGLQGNGRGYATISNWNGSSVAEHVRVSGDGYLRLAGTGIQFNGDTADANSLDDYEEGTWTPIIGGLTSQSGQSYSGQTGNYTKIGRLVTATFRAVLTNKGTITGDVVIKGLPFTVQNSISFGSGVTYWVNLSTAWNYIYFAPVANDTSALVEGIKTAASSTIRAATADIANDSQFNGTITYFV